MLSRFTVKIIANGLVAMIAMVFLASFFAENARDALLDDIHDFWAAQYMESLNEEAESALAQQELDRNPDTLIRVLGSSPWDQLRPGDRAYPLKRRIFTRLCTTLQERGDYERLVKWAGAWLSMNDRDLDARAFWFEGIRHISGRESEGLAGLTANYHDFPGNLHLQRFLAAAYLERGDTEAAAKIARSMMSNVLDDWEIFWATSDSDFFSERRSTRIDLSRGNSLETTLHFDLPVDATTVRIDLPAKTRLRIHNLRLSIGEVRNEVVFKEVRLSQMRYERGTLVSYGGIDPYFVLPVKRIEQTDPNAKIAVTLQLQISTVILGYELSLSHLFDET